MEPPDSGGPCSPDNRAVQPSFGASRGQPIGDGRFVSRPRDGEAGRVSSIRNVEPGWATASVQNGVRATVRARPSRSRRGANPPRASRLAGPRAGGRNPKSGARSARSSAAEASASCSRRSRGLLPAGRGAPRRAPRPAPPNDGTRGPRSPSRRPREAGGRGGAFANARFAGAGERRAWRIMSAEVEPGDADPGRRSRCAASAAPGRSRCRAGRHHETAPPRCARASARAPARPPAVEEGGDRTKRSGLMPLRFTGRSLPRGSDRFLHPEDDGP